MSSIRDPHYKAQITIIIWYFAYFSSGRKKFASSLFLAYFSAHYIKCQKLSNSPAPLCGGKGINNLKNENENLVWLLSSYVLFLAFILLLDSEHKQEKWGDRQAGAEMHLKPLQSFLIRLYFWLLHGCIQLQRENVWEKLWAISKTSNWFFLAVDPIKNGCNRGPTACRFWDCVWDLFFPSVSWMDVMCYLNIDSGQNVCSVAKII